MPGGIRNLSSVFVQQHELSKHGDQPFGAGSALKTASRPLGLLVREMAFRFRGADRYRNLLSRSVTVSEQIIRCRHTEKLVLRPRKSALKAGRLPAALWLDQGVWLLLVLRMIEGAPLQKGETDSSRRPPKSPLGPELESLLQVSNLQMDD
ncbi:hypothetical protein ACOJBM_35200 [Rhizobium beringeri]